MIITLTETENKKPLYLHLRNPKSEEKEGEKEEEKVTKCALPSINLPSSKCENYSDPKETKLKLLFHIKALGSLLDVKDQYASENEESENLEWKDPLSKDIFNWIDDISDKVEGILKPAGALAGQDLSRQLEEIAELIAYLAEDILVNPMSDDILDNPYIEGNYFIWGENLMKKCQEYHSTSPYTNAAFEPHPHLLARDILEWGKEFFPSNFVSNPSFTNEPLDSNSYRFICQNAEVIVAHRMEYIKREAYEKRLAEIKEKGIKANVTKFQLLQQRNLRVEEQLRQTGVQESERQQQLIDDLGIQLANIKDSLESNREKNKEKTSSFRSSIACLEATVLMNTNRIAELEIANSYLAYRLNSALAELNDNGGGGCNLM